MKARIPLTAAQQRAMKAEIKRQIVARDFFVADDFDIAQLYALRAAFGFGKRRLRRFYEAFYTAREELTKHYEMDDTGDATWLCEQELLRIGVDVRAWNKEMNR